MADESVKFTVDFEVGNAIGNANALRDAFRRITDATSEVGQASAKSFGSFESAVAGVIGSLAAVTAGAISVRAVIGTIFEGIQNADVLRDLHASINAISGSAEAGEKAWKRFEAVSVQTRVTGDELVKMYGETLPLAMERFASQDIAQRFVAQIAKAAPAMGLAVEEAMSRAQSLLAGRIRGPAMMNFAMMLGLDPKQLTSGIQLVSDAFPKLDKLAAEGVKIGDTFQSAGHKIKDALLDAFSEGFNEARGSVDKGLDGMVRAFKDPELLRTVSALGKLIADIGPPIIKAFGDAADSVGKLVKALIELREGKFGASGSFLVGVAADFNKELANDFRQGAKIQIDPISKAAYNKTAEFLENLAKKAIPQVVVGMGDMRKAEADLAKSNDAMNTSLADTGAKAKPFGDAMEKYAGVTQAAVNSLKEATLAFDQLFKPKETDPLLKALQDLDDSADKLNVKFAGIRDKLLADASKKGVPSDVAAGLKEIAAGYDALIAKSPQALAVAEDYLKKDFLRIAFEKDAVAIKNVDDAFDDFVTGALRNFTDMGALSNVGSGISEAFAQIKADMDVELAQAQKQDAMGIWAFTDAQKEAIKKKYADLAKDVLAVTQDVLKKAQDEFSDATAGVFAAAKPGDRSKDLDANMAGAVDAFAEFLSSKMPFDLPLEGAVRDADPLLTQVFKDAAKKSAEEFKAVFDEFVATVGGTISAGLLGGAKGFAESASRIFIDSVNKGAGRLSEVFGQVILTAFGKAPPDASKFPGGKNDPDFIKATNDANKQNAQILQAVTTVVGSVGQTMQIFENAKKGQEVSVLATTLAFTAAGASIGGWIGALVGAIAGLTISLLANAKARKEQPYASYGIQDGVPYVSAFPGKEQQFTNVTATMMNDMLKQMQTTLEGTRNEYIKLLMKFPEGIADSITAANFAPTMDKYKEKGLGFMHWLIRTIFPIEATVASFTSNKYKGNVQHLVTEEGDIGNPLWDKNAQKNFMQDFQNWVDNTLPKAIVDSFKAPLARGFGTLGLEVEKFNSIWDRLQAFDPKDAIKSLNELYDALFAFKGAEEFLSQRIYGGAGFEFNTPGLIGQGALDNNKPFADALAQADAGLVAMGATIEALIGPEQITQAKAWGDALTQRESAVKQFFQQVAAAIDNVIKGYQSSIRDLTLQGMKTKEGAPDVGAQVQYLKSYADSLYQQIQHAPTLEAATALSNELQKTILQIQQIGGAQSAEAAEAYRLWAIEQLKAAQTLVVTRLQELAQDVADQNKAFLDAIQGFIDAFRSATDQINADTGGGAPADGETPGNEGPGGGPSGRPYWVDPDQGYGGVGYEVLKPWERPDFERGRNNNPYVPPPPPGGNLLNFPAPPPQSEANLRVLIRQNEEMLAIMRTGTDHRVVTRVIIEGEGPPVEVDTTDDTENVGFIARTAAERGR